MSSVAPSIQSEMLMLSPIAFSVLCILDANYMLSVSVIVWMCFYAWLSAASWECPQVTFRKPGLRSALPDMNCLKTVLPRSASLRCTSVYSVKRSVRPGKMWSVTDSPGAGKSTWFAPAGLLSFQCLQCPERFDFELRIWEWQCKVTYLRPCRQTTLSIL